MVRALCRFDIICINLVQTVDLIIIPATTALVMTDGYSCSIKRITSVCLLPTLLPPSYCIVVVHRRYYIDLMTCDWAIHLKKTKVINRLLVCGKAMNYALRGSNKFFLKEFF